MKNKKRVYIYLIIIAIILIAGFFTVNYIFEKKDKKSSALSNDESPSKTLIHILNSTYGDVYLTP
jgi:hypothetical protein